MERENGRLKIHTAARPYEPPRFEPSGTEKKLGRRERALNRRRKRRGAVRRREPITLGEKLVRNTAVACALLLCALAVKNAGLPWTDRATEGLRQAMTMRVDWDNSLGKLSFVRALVPDTALVFLNLDGGEELTAPVSGQVIHEYTQQQPWLEYRCPDGQAVRAAMAGMVSTVGQGAGGDWIVVIDDGNGAQAVYGYLAQVGVRVGQSVEAGDEIGATASGENARLYFELRNGDAPEDPSPRLK